MTPAKMVVFVFILLLLLLLLLFLLSFYVVVVVVIIIIIIIIVVIVVQCMESMKSCAGQAPAVCLLDEVSLNSCGEGSVDACLLCAHLAGTQH